MLSVFYHNKKTLQTYKRHYPDNIKIKEFWLKDVTDRVNRQVSECEDIAEYTGNLQMNNSGKDSSPKEKGQWIWRAIYRRGKLPANEAGSNSLVIGYVNENNQETSLYAYEIGKNQKVGQHPDSVFKIPFSCKWNRGWVKTSRNGAWNILSQK